LTRPPCRRLELGSYNFLTHYYCCKYLIFIDESRRRAAPKVAQVNNPSPEGPALISPQRGGVYLETFNGMMEWWNNGILGLKTGPLQAD